MTSPRELATQYNVGATNQPRKQPLEGLYSRGKNKATTKQELAADQPKRVARLGKTKQH